MSGQSWKALSVWRRTGVPARGARSLSKPMRVPAPAATMTAAVMGELWESGEGFGDELGEEFAVGAASGAILEGFHDAAHVLFGGSAEFCDDGGDEGFGFGGGEGGWEVAFEDGDFCGFGGGEVGAAAGGELVDGIAALFDLFADDGDGVDFGEFAVGSDLFDGGVFDGGLEGAESGHGGLVLLFHGLFEVIHDLFVESGHGMEIGWVALMERGSGASMEVRLQGGREY